MAMLCGQVGAWRCARGRDGKGAGFVLPEKGRELRPAPQRHSLHQLLLSRSYHRKQTPRAHFLKFQQINTHGLTSDRDPGTAHAALAAVSTGSRLGASIRCEGTAGARREGLRCQDGPRHSPATASPALPFLSATLPRAVSFPLTGLHLNAVPRHGSLKSSTTRQLLSAPLGSGASSASGKGLRAGFCARLAGKASLVSGLLCGPPSGADAVSEVTLTAVADRGRREWSRLGPQSGSPGQLRAVLAQDPRLRRAGTA